MLKSQAQEDTLKGIKALMNARSSGSVSKKPAKCKLVGKNKDNIETEQKFYISSRTNYEHLMIVSGLKRKDLVDKTDYVINRIIHESDYFLEDCTFPFYHNLLTVDEETDKLHVEVNYNYAIPHIIYASCNQLYVHEEFMANYTNKEFFILIDLCTSLILNIITDTEFDYLVELFSRDKVINDFIKRLGSKVTSRADSDNLIVVTDYKNNQRMSEKIYGYIGTPTLKNLLSTYINHKMTALLPYIETSVKAKTQFCQLKSVHDYRFIFTLSNYNTATIIPTEYTTDLKYNKKTAQLEFISGILALSVPIRNNNNAIVSVIEPKYYLGSQAMDEVKSLAMGWEEG